MWERLRRYKALDAESRSLFWRAVRLLPQVTLSLRLRGYAKTEASLQSRAESNSEDISAGQDVALRIAKTCRMVRAASQLGSMRATCLAQSLTLWFLLQQQNISSVIKIGVRKKDGHMEAHAWVERNGVALNETDEVHQHYAPFEREFANTPSEPL
jgi:Transglutaminase-like superfamily